jgi:hypothetical protein
MPQFNLTLLYILSIITEFLLGFISNFSPQSTMFLSTPFKETIHALVEQIRVALALSGYLHPNNWSNPYETVHPLKLKTITSL